MYTPTHVLGCDSRWEWQPSDNMTVKWVITAQNWSKACRSKFLHTLFVTARVKAMLEEGRREMGKKGNLVCKTPKRETGN